MDSVRHYFTPGLGRPTWVPMDDADWDSALVAEVNSLRPTRVVDAGCGTNRFSGQIRNLIGVDLVHPAADLLADMVEAPIEPGSVDVVLALGSVNFGDEATVVRQLSCLRTWLKPGGRVFMRANPGIRYPDAPGLTIFPWSIEDAYRLGELAGLRVETPPVTVELASRQGARTRLVWRYLK